MQSAQSSSRTVNKAGCPRCGNSAFPNIAKMIETCGFCQENAGRVALGVPPLMTQRDYDLWKSAQS